MMIEVITHVRHQHDLELKSYNDPYTCDGCREIGFGSRYRCEECYFNLHKECALANKTTSHDLFGNATFKLLSKLDHDQTRYCRACASDASDLVYRSDKLGADLHPCCHSLPIKIEIDNVDLRLRDEMPSMCLWCNKPRSIPCFGFSYQSKCNRYTFHVNCATQMMLQESKKGVDMGNSFKQSIQVVMEISIRDILKRQRRRKMVMSFVIANLVLEISSAVLDQVSSSSSSVNKTQFAFFGMLISFAALLTCIVELIYEVRTEKLIWSWRGTLPFPWYYYQSHRNRGCKPFGTFKDIVGFVCALCQCVVATVSYCYIRRYDDYPIRISIFPIIFAFGILFSRILKNKDAKKPYCENETRPYPEIIQHIGGEHDNWI